jgi:hypothetical protein
VLLAAASVAGNYTITRELALAAGIVVAGIPTFKTADRALKLFSVYCEARLRGRARTSV